MAFPAPSHAPVEQRATIELRAGHASGVATLIDGGQMVGGLHVDVTMRTGASGMQVDWTVSNPTTAPVAIDEICIRLPDLCPVQVLERGWSVCSPVRSAAVDDVLLPVMARRDQADMGRTVRGITSHHVLVHDGGVVGFLDGRAEVGIIEVSSTRSAGSGVVAVLLLDGCELDPGVSRQLAPLWMATGDPDVLVIEFHDRWAAQSQARIPSRSPLGWWADPALSPSAMRAGIGLASAAGMATCVVDVTAAGVRELPQLLRPAGLRPGLRVRPFSLGPWGPLAAHAVEQSPGRPLVIDASLVADLTDAMVLDQLRTRFRDLAVAGWEHFVLEGVWMGALAGRRREGRTRTRAQALRDGLAAVREGAGPDAVIVVADSPMGPAVGVADRSITATLDVAGQATVLHRAVEHRRLWAAGCSALNLRPEGEHRGVSLRSRVDLAVATGACTWIGGDLRAYDEVSWALVAYMLDLGGAADVALQLEGTMLELPTVVAGTSGLRSRPLELPVGHSSSH